MKKRNSVGWWLLTGVVMIFFQIVIGGITRLTESGLSITEWNVVMGALPPLNSDEWQRNYNEYMLSPQGRIINDGMTIEGFKNIFWWEWIHRLWARLFAPVFLIPFLVFIYRRMFSRKMITRLLFVFVLGGMQGALGWFMVSTGLKDVPWVSPYSLCSHLLLATILFGYLIWLTLGVFFPDIAGEGDSHERKQEGFLSFEIFLLLLVFIQIGLGAFMAGGVAPAAIWYPTWPLIGESWVPSSVFSFSNNEWRTPLENPAFIQFVHRATAYLLVIFSIYEFIMVIKSNSIKLIKITSGILIVIVLIQALLGIITVLNSTYNVPVLWGVLHQAVGLILFSCATVLAFIKIHKHIFKT